MAPRARVERHRPGRCSDGSGGSLRIARGLDGLDSAALPWFARAVTARVTISATLAALTLAACGSDASPPERETSETGHDPEPTPPSPPPDCVRDASNGEVRSPESYNYRTFRPEAGGLYDETVFGPLTEPGAVLEDVPDDRRSDRWGHVVLARPVPHPEDASRQLRSVPVLPPAYRRFRRLDRAETQEWARGTRDRIMADPDAVYQSQGDPPSTILGEMGLWSFDEDRPLNDEEIEALEPVTQEPEVGGHYRRVINVSHRLHRLEELDAPARVLDEYYGSLRDAVAGLFAVIARLELSEDVRRRALARCVLDGPSR